MEIVGKKNDLQQNEDWVTQRLGRFSSSQLWRLMSEPKLKADKEAGNLSEGALTYVKECVAERITGHRAKEDFNSRFTDWGNDHEPIAKGIYQHLQKVEVYDSGYIPFGENFGGSPDGLIGENGIIEIKCPYTITAHLEHMITSDMKSDLKEYYWQCIGYLLITEREWLDFVSYSPNFPGIYQFKRNRMYREQFLTDIGIAAGKINKATYKFNQILNSITNAK